MPKTLQNTSLVRSVKNVVGNATGLPDGASVYLFGSACYRDRPHDVDMLFVYNTSLLPPATAYTAFKPLVRLIESEVAIPVHPIVLSEHEARKTGFIEDIEPIVLKSMPGLSEVT